MNTALRLRCLELAVKRSQPCEDVMETATRYLAFLKGSESNEEGPKELQERIKRQDELLKYLDCRLQNRGV